MNSSMYEAWLVQHEGWLLEKIGGLETIVAQQKRIKKTLTTKQKMVRLQKQNKINGI